MVPESEIKMTKFEIPSREEVERNVAAITSAAHSSVVNEQQKRQVAEQIYLATSLSKDEKTNYVGRLNLPEKDREQCANLAGEKFTHNYYVECFDIIFSNEKNATKLKKLTSSKINYLNSCDLFPKNIPVEIEGIQNLFESLIQFNETSLATIKPLVLKLNVLWQELKTFEKLEKQLEIFDPKQQPLLPDFSKIQIDFFNQYKSFLGSLDKFPNVKLDFIVKLYQDFEKCAKTVGQKSKKYKEDVGEFLNSTFQGRVCRELYEEWAKTCYYEEAKKSASSTSPVSISTLKEALEKDKNAGTFIFPPKDVSLPVQNKANFVAALEMIKAKDASASIQKKYQEFQNYQTTYKPINETELREIEQSLKKLEELNQKETKKLTDLTSSYQANLETSIKTKLYAKAELAPKSFLEKSEQQLLQDIISSYEQEIINPHLLQVKFPWVKEIRDSSAIAENLYQQQLRLALHVRTEVNKLISKQIIYVSKAYALSLAIQELNASLLADKKLIQQTDVKQKIFSLQKHAEVIVRELSKLNENNNANNSELDRAYRQCQDYLKQLNELTDFANQLPSKTASPSKRKIQITFQKIKAPQPPPVSSLKESESGEDDSYLHASRTAPDRELQYLSSTLDDYLASLEQVKSQDELTAKFKEYEKDFLPAFSVSKYSNNPQLVEKKNAIAEKLFDLISEVQPTDFLDKSTLVKNFAHQVSQKLLSYELRKNFLKGGKTTLSRRDQAQLASEFLADFEDLYQRMPDEEIDPIKKVAAHLGENLRNFENLNLELIKDPALFQKAKEAVSEYQKLIATFDTTIKHKLIQAYKELSKEDLEITEKQRAALQLMKQYVSDIAQHIVQELLETTNKIPISESKFTNASRMSTHVLSFKDPQSQREHTYSTILQAQKGLEDYLRQQKQKKASKWYLTCITENISALKEIQRSRGLFTNSLQELNQNVSRFINEQVKFPSGISTTYNPNKKIEENKDHLPENNFIIFAQRYRQAQDVKKQRFKEIEQISKLNEKLKEQTQAFISLFEAEFQKLQTKTLVDLSDLKKQIIANIEQFILSENKLESPKQTTVETINDYFKIPGLKRNWREKFKNLVESGYKEFTKKYGVFLLDVKSYIESLKISPVPQNLNDWFAVRRTVQEVKELLIAVNDLKKEIPDLTQLKMLFSPQAEERLSKAEMQDIFGLPYDDMRMVYESRLKSIEGENEFEGFKQQVQKVITAVEGKLESIKGVAKQFQDGLIQGIVDEQARMISEDFLQNYKLINAYNQRLNLYKEIYLDIVSSVAIDEDTQQFISALSQVIQEYEIKLTEKISDFEAKSDKSTNFARLEFEFNKAARTIESTLDHLKIPPVSIQSFSDYLQAQDNLVSYVKFEKKFEEYTYKKVAYFKEQMPKSELLVQKAEAFFKESEQYAQAFENQSTEYLKYIDSTLEAINQTISEDQSIGSNALDKLDTVSKANLQLVDTFIKGTCDPAIKKYEDLYKQWYEIVEQAIKDISERNNFGMFTHYRDQDLQKISSLFQKIEAIEQGYLKALKMWENFKAEADTLKKEYAEANKLEGSKEDEKVVNESEVVMQPFGRVFTNLVQSEGSPLIWQSAKPSTVSLKNMDAAGLKKEINKTNPYYIMRQNTSETAKELALRQYAIDKAMLLLLGNNIFTIESKNKDSKMEKAVQIGMATSYYFLQAMMESHRLKLEIKVDLKTIDPDELIRAKEFIDNVKGQIDDLPHFSPTYFDSLKSVYQSLGLMPKDEKIEQSSTIVPNQPK